MEDLKLSQINFPNNDNTYHIPTNLTKEYENKELVMALTYHTEGSDVYNSTANNAIRHLLMYLSVDGLNFTKMGSIPLNMKELHMNGNPYDFSVVWCESMKQWIIAYDYSNNATYTYNHYGEQRTDYYNQDLLRTAKDKCHHRQSWEGNNDNNANDNLGGYGIGFLLTSDFIHFKHYELDIPLQYRVYTRANNTYYRFKPTKNGLSVQDLTLTEVNTTFDPNNFWASTWGPELFIETNSGGANGIYLSVTVSSWDDRFQNSAKLYRKAKDKVIWMKIDFRDEDQSAQILYAHTMNNLPASDYLPESTARHLDLKWDYDNGTYTFTSANIPENNEWANIVYTLKQDNNGNYYLSTAENSVNAPTKLQLQTSQNSLYADWCFFSMSEEEGNKFPTRNERGWYALSENEQRVYFSVTEKTKFKNYIDPFIIKKENDYYLAIKDETNIVEKLFKLAHNTTINPAFLQLDFIPDDCYIFDETSEGISIVKFKNKYLAYADQFVSTLSVRVHTPEKGNTVSLWYGDEDEGNANFLTKWTSVARVNNEGGAYNRHFTAVTLPNTEEARTQRKSVFNFIQLKSSNIGAKLEQSSPNIYYPWGQTEIACLLLMPGATYVIDRDMDVTIKKVNSFFLQQGDTCEFMVNTSKGSFTFEYNPITPPQYIDNSNKEYRPELQREIIGFPHWGDEQNLVFDIPYSSLQLKCLYKNWFNFNYMDTSFAGPDNNFTWRTHCPKQDFLLMERPATYQTRCINLVTLYDEQFTEGTWQYLQALKRGDSAEINANGLGFTIEVQNVTPLTDGGYIISGNTLGLPISFIEKNSTNISLIEDYYNTNSTYKNLFYSFRTQYPNITFDTNTDTFTSSGISMINNDEFFIGDMRFRTLRISGLTMNPNVMYVVTSCNTVILSHLQSNLQMGEKCYFTIRDRGTNVLTSANIIFDETCHVDNKINDKSTGALIWNTNGAAKTLIISESPTVCTIYGIGTAKCVVDHETLYQKQNVYRIGTQTSKNDEIIPAITVELDYGANPTPETYLNKNYTYLIYNTNLIVHRLHRGNLQIGDSCLFLLQDANSSITFTNSNNFQWANNNNESTFTLRNIYEGVRITAVDEWKYLVEKVATSNKTNTAFFDDIVIDNTLAKPGSAADAQIVGTHLNGLQVEINELKQKIQALSVSDLDGATLQSNINDCQNRLKTIEATLNSGVGVPLTQIDATLSKRGCAADAYYVGNHYTNLRAEINELKKALNDSEDSGILSARITQLEQMTGKVYYVSQIDGNNNNNGTSVASAFKTIEYALQHIITNTTANSSIKLYICGTENEVYYINPIKLTDYHRNLNLEICGLPMNNSNSSTREKKLNIIITDATSIEGWAVINTSNAGIVVETTINDSNIKGSYSAATVQNTLYHFDKCHQLIQEDSQLRAIEPCRLGGYAKGVAIPQYFDFQNPDIDTNFKSLNITTNYKASYTQAGAMCNLWCNQNTKLAIITNPDDVSKLVGTWCTYATIENDIAVRKIRAHINATNLSNIDFKLSLPITRKVTEAELNSVDNNTNAASSKYTLVKDIPENINNAFVATLPNLLHFEGFNSIKLSNITLSCATNHCLYVKTCPNLEVTNCIFENAGNANGVFLDTNTNTKFSNCESRYNRGDGFGISGVGNASFIRCIGHHNGDDGLSHHNKGCQGIVLGGSYYHNGKGGIASPSHYSSNEINSVETYDNNIAGIYAIKGNVNSSNPLDFPKVNISNCYIHDENIGIKTQLYPIDCWNCVFVQNKQDTYSELNGKINIVSPPDCKIIFNKKPKILLLGDSVCAGYGASDYNTKILNTNNNVDKDYAKDEDISKAPYRLPLMIDLSNASCTNLIDSGNKINALSTKSESWKGFRYLRSSEHSWASRFKAYVEAAYPGSIVVNRGWAGATVWELKTALQDLINYRTPNIIQTTASGGRTIVSDIASEEQYDYAIVQIGINSIFGISALNAIDDLSEVEKGAAANLANFNRQRTKLDIDDIITTLLKNNITPIIATNTPINQKDHKLSITWYEYNNKVCYYYKEDGSGNYSEYEIRTILGLDATESLANYTHTLTYTIQTLPLGSEEMKGIIIEACANRGIPHYDIQGEVNWFLTSTDQLLNDYLNDPLHPNDRGFNLIFNIYKRLLNA